MPLLKMRITGTSLDIEHISARLSHLDGISRAEPVNDLMPASDDDSSSAGLAEAIASQTSNIEFEAIDDATAEAARLLAERSARELGVVLEIVDDF